jgi:hypothetical protein
VAFFIDEGSMVEITLLFLAPKFLKVKHFLFPINLPREEAISPRLKNQELHPSQFD